MGHHQLLVYADDVHILGDTRRYHKGKHTPLIDASKEIGLEVNIEETKYMLLSRYQNAGQNFYLKIGSRYFENVMHFGYLGTTIETQNLIQEEIKEESELR
jgi:hypothetical protein